MTIRDRILKAAEVLLADDKPVARQSRPRKPRPQQAIIDAASAPTAIEKADDTPTSMPSLWSNYYTGLGSTSGDRTAYHAPGAIIALEDTTLATLWQGDPIARTVIEAIVDDGMRAGFQVAYTGESERDKELIGEVDDLATALDLEGQARLAAKASRALRGAGLIVVANGGRMSAAQPLDDERVTTVDRLIVWDSRDMQVATWQLDRHETYFYSPSSMDGSQAQSSQFHSSHVVLFPGIDTTLRDRQLTWLGWYRPVLQNVVETIRDFRQSWQSTVAMLQDGSQGVLSLPDLARTLSTVGRSVLETRLSLIQLYRWAGRIMPIDAGGGAVPPEKFEWVERSFSGIAELLHEHMPLVAQAADMPLTRLFGDFSTAGLNNAGAGAERNWFATVQAWRRGHIQPGIERIVRLLAKQAGASDWQRWSIEWPELEVLSSQERANLEKSEAETDALRVQQGMPEEVILRHRYGQGTYSHSAPLLNEEDLKSIAANVEQLGLPFDEPEQEEPEAKPEGEVKVQPAETVDPSTALNGAQVAALKEIVLSVAAGEIPRTSGIEIIVASFPVDRATAERIMGEVGRGFSSTVASAETPEQLKPFTGEKQAEEEPAEEITEEEPAEPEDEDEIPAV